MSIKMTDHTSSDDIVFLNDRTTMEEQEALKQKLSMEDMSFIDDFSCNADQILGQRVNDSFTDEFVASLGIKLPLKSDQFVVNEEIRSPSFSHQVVQSSYVPTAQIATQGTTSVPAIVGSPAVPTPKNTCQADSSEAEDIVRKLCKNGKLMEFQEGEDFIKVIVYEDSADESDKENDSRSAGGIQEAKHDSTNRPGVLQPIVSDSQIIQSLDNSTSTEKCLPIKHTPHPRNGYMFYNNDVGKTDTPINDSRQRRVTPSSHLSAFQERNGPPINPKLHPTCTPVSHLSRLNSSGEENVSPPDIIQAPTSDQLQNRVRSLIDFPQYQILDENGKKIREQHNQKERRRRARIKDACNLLRQLVPGMSDKTDKATVFEFAARYVHFLKSHSGAQYDKDFLMKYSPY